MAKCKGITGTGNRCRKPAGDNGYCSTPAHQAQAKDPVPELRTSDPVTRTRGISATPQQVKCVSCKTLQAAKPGNHTCTGCSLIFNVRA